MVSGPNHHLTPEEIAAYLAGQATEDRRLEMEEHLASCDECREDLIGAAAIPTATRPWVRRTLVLGPLAAAILAGIIFLPSAPTDLRPTDNTPRLRGGEEEEAFKIQPLDPGPSVSPPVQDLTFRWRSAGDDAFYTLTLTNQVGDILWTVSTADTVILLADSVDLAAGTSYFWYVDGLLPGARTATTGIQEFSIQR